MLASLKTTQAFHFNAELLFNFSFKSILFNSSNFANIYKYKNNPQKGRQLDYTIHGN